MKLDALQRMQVMQLRRMPLEVALDRDNGNLETTATMMRNLDVKVMNVETSSMDVAEVEERIVNAVDKDKIQHIIIDNMQYLLYSGTYFRHQPKTLNFFNFHAARKNAPSMRQRRTKCAGDFRALALLPSIVFLNSAFIGLNFGL